MYANGYEPRIGDKVKRKWYDINMAEGEEGVVCFVGEHGRVKITGKPDNAGFNEIFFDLLSRAVRYADGNDAAVGDLVECVKDARCDTFTGRVGERYEIAAVRGNWIDDEGGIDLKPQFDESNCGLRPIRFKLIARACPYLVEDWVIAVNPITNIPFEFQVKGRKFENGRWWVVEHYGIPESMWSVDKVKPGRLPPKPAPQPISVADEVRAIMTEGDETDLFNRRTWKVDKIVDLINAKTERLEKLVLELNRKIVNQRDELSSQNATCRNYKGEIETLRARVQSLNDIAANKEKTLQGLFDAAHRRTAEIVDLKGTIAEQVDMLCKLRAEVRSKDDALQNAGGRNRALEENIARERSRNVQLHDELRTLGDYKALYENLRNKLRDVAE